MDQEHQTTLNVQGMTCGSCTRHVKHALQAVDGVSHIEIEMKEGKVRVHHQLEAAPVTDLLQALRQAGYAATVEAF